MNNYSKDITTKEANSFCIGMFGQNLLYCIISTGLLYYYQSVIFIPAVFVGILLSTVQIIDAIKDPIMGVIVDKTKNKHGKCKIYLIYGVPIATICTILPFCNSIYTSQNSANKNILIVLWAFLAYFIWVIAYTLIDVPLWGLASCLTPNINKRNKLLAGARIAASIAGGIVPLIIVPIAQFISYNFTLSSDNNVSLQYSMIIVSIVLAFLGGMLMLPNNIYAKERVHGTNQSATVKEIISNIFKCKPYRKVIFAGILRSPIMIIAIIQMTLFSYYFGNNGKENYMIYMIIIGGCYVVGQILSMGITNKLLNKLSVKLLNTNVSIITACSFGALWVLYSFKPNSLNEPLYTFIFALLFFIDGFGTGSLNLIQSIMTTECIDYEEKRTGIRPDGTFMAGQSFVIKLSTGIATIITTIAYEIVGFSGKNMKYINDALYNGLNFRTDSMFEPYRNILFLLCSIPPMIGILLSIIPLLKYNTFYKSDME
ncbi:MAG: MFS transporter [Eubacterium sp.]